MTKSFYFLLGFVLATGTGLIADRFSHVDQPWDGPISTIDEKPQTWKSCTCPDNTVSQGQYDALKKYVDALYDKTKVEDKYIQGALDSIAKLSNTCPSWITDGKGGTPNMMEKKEKTVEWTECIDWYLDSIGHKVCTKKLILYSNGSIGWKKSEQSK